MTTQKGQMRTRGRKGFRQTGAILATRIRAAGESRGFAESRLLTQWEVICGAEIAAVARPLKVSYARDGFGATLTIACEGARAAEVQMLAPQIREKVNGCYGYNAISRVRITQTDASGFAEAQARYKPKANSRPRPADIPPPKEVSVIGDPGLRDALARLGQNIRSRTGSQETGET